MEVTEEAVRRHSTSRRADPTAPAHVRSPAEGAEHSRPATPSGTAPHRSGSAAKLRSSYTALREVERAAALAGTYTLPHLQMQSSLAQHQYYTTRQHRRLLRRKFLQQQPSTSVLLQNSASLELFGLGLSQFHSHENVKIDVNNVDLKAHDVKLLLKQLGPGKAQVAGAVADPTPVLQAPLPAELRKGTPLYHHRQHSHYGTALQAAAWKEHLQAVHNGETGAVSGGPGASNAHTSHNPHMNEGEGPPAPPQLTPAEEYVQSKRRQHSGAGGDNHQAKPRATQLADSAGPPLVLVMKSTLDRKRNRALGNEPSISDCLLLPVDSAVPMPDILAQYEDFAGALADDDYSGEDDYRNDIVGAIREHGITGNTEHKEGTKGVRDRSDAGAGAVGEDLEVRELWKHMQREQTVRDSHNRNARSRPSSAVPTKTAPVSATVGTFAAAAGQGTAKLGTIGVRSAVSTPMSAGQLHAPSNSNRSVRQLARAKCTAAAKAVEQLAALTAVATVTVPVIAPFSPAVRSVPHTAAGPSPAHIIQRLSSQHHTVVKPSTAPVMSQKTRAKLASKALTAAVTEEAAGRREEEDSASRYGFSSGSRSGSDGSGSEWNRSYSESGTPERRDSSRRPQSERTAGTPDEVRHTQAHPLQQGRPSSAAAARTTRPQSGRRPTSASPAVTVSANHEATARPLSAAVRRRPQSGLRPTSGTRPVSGTAARRTIAVVGTANADTSNRRGSEALRNVQRRVSSTDPRASVRGRVVDTSMGLTSPAGRLLSAQDTRRTSGGHPQQAITEQESLMSNI
jgi:hypothetical protein